MQVIRRAAWGHICKTITSSYQGNTHGEILGQADQCIIYRLIAVGMVFSQSLTNNAGTFPAQESEHDGVIACVTVEEARRRGWHLPERFVVKETQIMHGI